jgi:hypothetical protein
MRELHALTGDRANVFPGRDPLKPMSDAAINAALDLTTGIAQKYGGAYGLGVTYAKTMLGAHEG